MTYYKAPPPNYYVPPPNYYVPPPNYYAPPPNYYAPPPKHRSSRTVWILVGILVVVGVMGLALIGVVLTGHPFGHHYSANEQLFLTDVKKATPTTAVSTGPWAPWPNDAELVREGHKICLVLADYSEHKDPAVMNPEITPEFMSHYSPDQGVVLMSTAINDLCHPYVVWGRSK
jgi:hypothetical protein